MRSRILVLAGLLFAVLPIARADEWSKTYTVTGKPDLRVETSDASIRVDTWDQNTIDVRVTTERYKIGDNIKIIEHQNGDSVEIEVRESHHNFVISFGPGRVEVTVHMPRQGKVNLHTGDGSITLANFKGDMDLQSGDGHEEIDEVDGTLRAHTGDGHIRASGRFDALDINTGDGRVEARAIPGSTIASSWNIRTGDGGVTLELPANLAADVDLHTSDGHISLDVPVSVEGRLGERSIHGKINGGGNPLTVRTGDGSIRIEKS